MGGKQQSDTRPTGSLPGPQNSIGVSFNQTASVFGQAYDSPLGKQQLQVGVNMPMVQWGAGRAS